MTDLIIEQFKIVIINIAHPSVDFRIAINLMCTCKILFKYFSTNDVWRNFSPFPNNRSIETYKIFQCSTARNKYHDDYFRLKQVCDIRNIGDLHLGYFINCIMRCNTIKSECPYILLTHNWLSIVDILTLSKWHVIKHFVKFYSDNSLCKLYYGHNSVIITRSKKKFIKININNQDTDINTSISILNKLFYFNRAEEFLNMFINKQKQLRKQ